MGSSVVDLGLLGGVRQGGADCGGGERGRRILREGVVSAARPGNAAMEDGGLGQRLWVHKPGGASLAQQQSSSSQGAVAAIVTENSKEEVGLSCCCVSLHRHDRGAAYGGRCERGAVVDGGRRKGRGGRSPGGSQGVRQQWRRRPWSSRPWCGMLESAKDKLQGGSGHGQGGTVGG